MSGRIRNYSCSTSSAGHASLPVCLPTISAPRDSCGAIPFTTGMRFAQPVIAGRSTACVPCSLTWMRFALITSAVSRPHGTYPRVHSRLRPDHGCQGWAPAFSKTVRHELGHLPFIAEDLSLITPDVQVLRDQFQLPGTRVLQFAFDG